MAAIHGILRSSATGEKREKPGHCCQSMKHLPDLDISLRIGGFG